MKAVDISDMRPTLARLVRRAAVPVILFWIISAGILSLTSPPLEDVASQRAVAVMPEDSSASQAMRRIGEVFDEFSSDSSAMVVLEGQGKLTEAAHEFCNQIVDALRADTEHVEHVQDFWSDPITAGSSESADGKAAYVQVFLVGDQGSTRSNESVTAVRQVVDRVPAPEGVAARLTGNTVLVGDTNVVAHESFAKMALASVVVILVMLLAIYRSPVTAIICLLVVIVELFAAQTITANLGNLGVISITPFATSTITALSIAAATDYLIFLQGRYHEARSLGEDREMAFYTAFRGVYHVILASGMTIAGACLCLTAAQLPTFHNLGLPCAVAMVVVVISALTFAPAVLALASRFGLLDPKRELSTRRWRRIGAAVVRWPKPIFLVTAAIATIGFGGLLTYVPKYNDQKFTPSDMPANVAYMAAERHFTQARMNPELLMVETDRDLRDPAGMLLIDRIAKNVFHERGIARVQTITRPLGSPLEHGSIPFQIAMKNSGTLQAAKFMNDSTAEALQMANEMGRTIAIMEHTYAVMEELTAATHSMTSGTHDIIDTANEARDHIADFDDFFRPIRNYFHWEPHCFDIPACWSLRSVLDAVDSVDQISERLTGLSHDFDHADGLMPELLADFPQLIDSLKMVRALTLSTQSRAAGLQALVQESAEGTSLMGQHFDEAKNDDLFYLPQEVFENADFQRVLKLFVSPNGKAVRFVITHEYDPVSVDGIKHVAGIKDAVADATKGTPLEGARVWLTGPGSAYSDIQRGVVVDLLVVGIASLIIIFSIMLLVTRSIVAALVIVGTVAASLGMACGLSVIVWQHLIGSGIQWVALPLSVVILLAVGSDYNLMLVSRLQEGIDAGLNTSIIRGMGASGRVVTAAGLVFAFTMMTMIISDLRLVGQIGTTIGLGLLVDTLIVRAFMTPSIAAALGRWFWWPLNTFRGKASAGEPRNRPSGPRQPVEASEVQLVSTSQSHG
nr:MMPL family transporter [Mycobacterium sp. UM_NZ2]